MPVPGCLPTRAHLGAPVGLPIPARPPALARRRLHHLRRLRPSKYAVDRSAQRKPDVEFARRAVSSRAYCSVSIESTFLSRRIALILGKRSASPLAWRELG